MADLVWSQIGCILKRQNSFDHQKERYGVPVQVEERNFARVEIDNSVVFRRQSQL